MERYDQHHVFNLTLNEDDRLERRVRVSVNTDNPAVCHTTLAHEHYLLGEVLIKKGVPEAEVAEWLEWLRHNGEEYNFVRRLKSAKDDVHMEALINWLSEIRPTVFEAQTRDEKHDAFWNWLRNTRLRDHGFTAAAIAANLDTLEPIIALEGQMAALRRSVSDLPGQTEDLSSKVEDLQQQIDRIKSSLVM